MSRAAAKSPHHAATELARPTPPIGPGSPCTCVRLRQAMRRVTQLYDQILKPSGLRVTQFSLLARLVRSEPIALLELARRLGMDRTTLTRNLEPLARQGLVEIVAGADRRQRVARLTAAGEAAWERGWTYWRLAQSAIAGEVGQSEIELLHTQLEAVTRGAERLGAPADGDDPPSAA